MLDKKQIQAIFLFEFKMGHKATETTQNINNAVGPGTANEHTVQWWFKKFCQGDKSFEDEKHSGWPLEADNNSWEPLLKLILLQLHEKLPKNSTSTVLWSFGIWNKLERWKSWPKIFKNHHSEVSSSLILCKNNEPFLDQIVTSNEKWIL